MPSFPLGSPYAEPTDINASPLTHILYSFADVSPETGSISLTDSYADEQVRPCRISRDEQVV